MPILSEIGRPPFPSLPHSLRQKLLTDYVADIYSTLTTTPRTDLRLVEEELKEQVPDPLHCILEKESKERKRKLLFALQYVQFIKI